MKVCWKSFVWVITGMAVITTAMSFLPLPANPSASLTIQLDHVVGKSVLELDTAIYSNALGQVYEVNRFKYYLSNFQLKKKDGTEFRSSETFLVDEDKPVSKQIHLKNISAGDYVSISFIIGVDSLHNCSGAQSGALDPVNGMFWTWNNGYIFLKLEGHSTASHSPGKIFEYHIGGYKPPSNCIRHVRLALPAESLSLTAGKTALLRLQADVSEVLKNPNTVDFSKLSAVSDPLNSGTIADNYADMFSLANH
jgi:hypothetical protein